MEQIYRIVKPPLTDWNPYTEEPIYEDAPWLGSFTNRSIPRHPAPGDFLVITDSSAQVVGTCDMHSYYSGNCFENVRFRQMPSLEDLLESGTVRAVSEDEKYHEDMLRIRRLLLDEDIQSGEIYREELDRIIQSGKTELQVDGITFRFHTDETIAAFLDKCIVDSELDLQRTAKVCLEEEIQTFCARYVA